MESRLQTALLELCGMCLKNQPLLTWEHGSSALGFMQIEVPPEQTFQWDPAPSPQLPEETTDPAGPPVSAQHPHVWEQGGVGCWGLGQRALR